MKAGRRRKRKSRKPAPSRTKGCVLIVLFWVWKVSASMKTRPRSIWMPAMERGRRHDSSSVHVKASFVRQILFLTPRHFALSNQQPNAPQLRQDISTASACLVWRPVVWPSGSISPNCAAFLCWDLDPLAGSAKSIDVSNLRTYMCSYSKKGETCIEIKVEQKCVFLQTINFLSFVSIAC